MEEVESQKWCVEELRSGTVKKRVELGPARRLLLPFYLAYLKRRKAVTLAAKTG